MCVWPLSYCDICIRVFDHLTPYMYSTSTSIHVQYIHVYIVSGPQPTSQLTQVFGDALCCLSTAPLRYGLCDGVGNASEHRYYRHIAYNITWSEDLRLTVFDHAFELSMCIVVLHFMYIHALLFV